MNPTRGDVHIDQVLTNLSLTYARDYRNSIADKVFPVVGVNKQSDRYWVYDRDAFMRTVAEKRAPATESVGGHFTYGDNSYFAEVYAVHKDIDDQTRANVDSPLNLDADATMWVTNQLLIRRDLLWIERYFKTGVWGTDFAGVATGTPTASQFLRWDVSGSDPIAFLRARITAMEEATGIRPNVLAFGPKVWNALADHASLLERIKYTERGQVGPDLLGSLLGIPTVMPLRAVYNTAAAGAAGSYSFMAGKHAWLGYAAPAAGLQTISAGYTFAWTGYGTFAPQIRNFRLELIRSDRIEGEMAFDMAVTATDLGMFFADAVS